LRPVKAHLLLFIILGLSASASAQTPRPTQPSGEDRTTKGSIRGRVVLPGSSLISESVKVTLLTVNGIQSTAYSDNQGWFEFPDLTPGNYEVQVEANGNQFEIVNQSVQVFRGAPSIITISLRERNASRSAEVKERSISLGELGSDVPKNARKEFELATKASQSNRQDEAITHLGKAIKLYPNFVMARNDLGTQLMAQGKLEEAADEFRQAILIDEKAFNPKLNLGILLVHEHDFVEAVSVLDQAVALKPDSPAARLYLGEAQLGLANLDSAEKEIKTAYSLGGKPYALALFYLGQIYMSKGNREMAQISFESYLREVPNAANGDQVRKLIAMLH
jgi:tetratricopeptide (TPR) repeat protein